MTSDIKKSINENSFKWIYGVSITLVFIFGTIGAWTGAWTGRYVFYFNALAECALIMLLYSHRAKLIFTPLGAALGATGLVMNAAGSVGAYNLVYAGIGWDKALHFVTMTGITLIIYAYIKEKKSIFSMGERTIIVLLVAAGIGAMNEIFEFIGTQYFGIGQGLFGSQNGTAIVRNDLEIFDTQWDLITNTLATMLTITYANLKNIHINNASVENVNINNIDSPNRRYDKRRTHNATAQR